LRKSNPISSWDNFHVEGIGVLFFILGLTKPVFYIVLMIYMLLMHKKMNIILVVILFSLVFIRFYLWFLKDIPYQVQGEVKVVEVIHEELYDSLIIKYQQSKYRMNVSSELYELGDILYLNGEIKPFRSMTIPYGFDQQIYYLSKNIRGYVDIKDIRKINHEVSFYIFRDKLEQQISKYQSSIYLKSLILGEKTFSDEQNELFGELGILYLFSVSGLHIYVFLLIMKKVFFYLSLSKRTQDMLTLLIYLFFLYLNSFSFGVFRLILMFIFKGVNEKYGFELTKLDGMQIVFFMMIMFNIHWVFHQGVLITYLILMMLYLTEFLYQGQKGYLKKLLMSTLIFLVILPFSNQISLLMLLMLPILIVIFSGPVFMGSILIVLIPELDFIFNKAIQNMEWLLQLMSNKNISINLPSMDVLMVFIYYVFLVYLLRSKSVISLVKRSLILVMILCSPFIKFSISDITKVYFLDVGQGDSIYIENNTCKLMIDSYQSTESFLKNRGVYTLDYLILTHSDSDHIKEAQDIIDHFLVKNLVLSAYIDDYPTYLTPKSWIKAGDHLTCGNLELNFISPLKRYENRNLNSLVFQILIDRTVFLFTGDIEGEVELDLINHYGFLLKSDVLKVAHHGSSTSTGESFLYHVSPDTAIISAGYENKFKFPSDSVIQRLQENNIMIYRTDLQGTIIFTSDKKKQKWKVCIPFLS